MTVNLKRYALVYFAMIVGLAVISTGLGVFGISMPSGLSSILPAGIAALIEGQKAAEAKAPAFTAPQAWAQARRMTAVVIAINVVTFVGIMLVLPDLRSLFASIPALLAGVAVVLIGISFLINRFALTWGHKIQSQAIAKREGATP